MIHLGDICKINGAEIPVVDVITGGSPCQDLSNAGKRAGLEGERSGLFMEQLRIVKEMREHDRSIGRTGEFIRPRYMVWENVPGAFSSHKGEDFKTVLTEIVKIVCEEIPDLPMPDKGKWTKQGCLYDDMGKWSIAWRVHDAQFWGVPQRRKRIALVADFGGRSAPEILFERKGLSWNPAQSEGEEQTVAGGAGRSTDATSGSGKCLNALDIQSKHVQPEEGKAEALYSGERRYGGGESYVMKTIALEGNGSRPSHHGDGYAESETMYSLNTVEQHGVFSFQERAGKPGGGKGVLMQGDHVGALQTQQNQYAVLNDRTSSS